MYRSLFLAGILFATVPCVAMAKPNQINIVKDQKTPNELELRPLLKSLLIGGVTGGLSGTVDSGMLAKGEASPLTLGLTSLAETWARGIAANNLEIPQGYQIYMWGASWASWIAVVALKGGVPHAKTGGKLFLIGAALHLTGWIR